MPALLINDEIYGNTPTDKQEEFEERLTAAENAIEATKKVETGTLGKPITGGTYNVESLQKKDGIVYLYCGLQNISLSGYNTIWATLPNGFRPLTDVYLNGRIVSSNGISLLRVYISKAGNIYQSSGSLAATELFVCGSFIAAE